MRIMTPYRSHTNSFLEEGVTYWVCAYRFTDVRKYVPVKHVKPTEVVCIKTFGDLKDLKTKGGRGKTIAIWENIRYPEPIYIFDNREECVAQYNSLVDARAKELKEHIDYLNSEYEKMLKLKIDN